MGKSHGASWARPHGPWPETARKATRTERVALRVFSDHDPCGLGPDDPSDFHSFCPLLATPEPKNTYICMPIMRRKKIAAVVSEDSAPRCVILRWTPVDVYIIRNPTSSAMHPSCLHYLLIKGKILIPHTCKYSTSAVGSPSFCAHCKLCVVVFFSMRSYNTIRSTCWTLQVLLLWLFLFSSRCFFLICKQTTGHCVFYNSTL